MTLRQDYESSASKLKMLEKQVKTLRQEKDEVHKVVVLAECCCLQSDHMTRLSVTLVRTVF